MRVEREIPESGALLPASGLSRVGEVCMESV